jgi:diacylglycerol kinase family enzyme
MLPTVLNGGAPLRLSADGNTFTGPQAVLVSNNPYGNGTARRPRLDSGVLGVLAVTVRGALDAAGLISGGGRSRSLTTREVTEAVIDADAAELPVGVDGEALMLATPVRCTIRPGVLRVRVPRHRPGVRPFRPELDWTRLRRLAWAGRRNDGEAALIG